MGRRRAQALALTLALSVLAVVWLAPIVWVLVTSLKVTADIVRLPPEWIPWPMTAEHYHEVLFSSSRTARIGRAFANSLVVALGTVLIVVVTAAMAAYPLARMRFPGRDVVFTLLVGSLMIPNAVVLVPQYVLVQRRGWLSTYQARPGARDGPDARKPAIYTMLTSRRDVVVRLLDVQPADPVVQLTR